jgi:putative redox protein
MANIKTTTVHHLVGKRFVGITPDQQKVMIDGEAVAKTGMNPMEVLLNAVGACAAFDIVEMIAKRRLELKSYHIELEGTRADTKPAYYTHIKARHFFNAPGLDQKTAERFVDLGMNKYCSVAASLKADISFEVVLENDSVEKETSTA